MEVKYLQTLIDAGIKYVDPFATLFLGHVSWFGPLLEDFRADCEARGVPEPGRLKYTFKKVEGVERPAMFAGGVLLLVKRGD